MKPTEKQLTLCKIKNIEVVDSDDIKSISTKISNVLENQRVERELDIYNSKNYKIQILVKDGIYLAKYKDKIIKIAYDQEEKINDLRWDLDEQIEKEIKKDKVAKLLVDFESVIDW